MPVDLAVTDIHYQNGEASFFLLGDSFLQEAYLLPALQSPEVILSPWTRGTLDQMPVLSVFCLWPVSWSFVVNSYFPLQPSRPVHFCPELSYL